MEITYTEGGLTVDVYQGLRARVGWKPFSRRQAALALEGSLYIVCAWDGDQPVGMGRLVGDASTICYIQDLIVLPGYRRAHVGTKLIERLERVARSYIEPGETMRLCLMCARGREPFYESCGFLARPTPDLGPGMIRYLETAEEGQQEEAEG